MIFEKLSIPLFLFANAIDASAPNTDGVPEEGSPQPLTAEEILDSWVRAREPLEKSLDLASRHKHEHEHEPAYELLIWGYGYEKTKQVVKKDEPQSDTSDHD